jgi:DMSO reductase anchor subunit
MERARKRREHTREERKEHVMMFAFVLALIGVVVLASFEHLGARS